MVSPCYERATSSQSAAKRSCATRFWGKGSCEGPRVGRARSRLSLPSREGREREPRRPARAGGAAAVAPQEGRGSAGARSERGRCESRPLRAEPQWIVATRPLCHLQYPAAHPSRLQGIRPPGAWKCRCGCTLLGRAAEGGPIGSGWRRAASWRPVERCFWLRGVQPLAGQW